jgi:putative protease
LKNDNRFKKIPPLPSKPELLAPAGGPASFAAAIKAGADAIYAGLDHFSARSYAENFNLPELKGLIEESHRAGVKVYLAFNSLIKESELAPAFRLLMAAAEMMPDAFILQDLGLANLAKRYCGNIPRHASTLTSVYNPCGLKALKTLGFSRSVLPRELTLSEISFLATTSPLPVEIFIHGALCFSFSGLCLMSSFQGGRSALRGACAQPCRRAYQNGGQQKTFFSTPDFITAPLMQELKNLPITAFKIEGRMKGADYVFKTTSAYRLLLDSNDEEFSEILPKALELLDQAPERPTATVFLGQNPIAASSQLVQNQSVSGVKIGYLGLGDKGQGIIKLENPLKILDRLRLVSKTGEEGLSFKLKKMWIDGQEVEEAPIGAKVTLELQLDTDKKLSPGLIYKTGSAKEEKEFLASSEVQNLKKIAKTYKPAKELNSSITFPHINPGSKLDSKYLSFWFWLDEPKDIEKILPNKSSKIILPLTASNIKEFNRIKKRLRPFPDVLWSLPPLVFSKNFEKLKTLATSIIESGANTFIVSNLGQIEFLTAIKPNLKIWGDHRLGILNHLAGNDLINLGLTGLCLSTEIDEDTYNNLAKVKMNGHILVYLYGRPALFSSRFKPLGLKRGPIISSKKEKFWASEEGDAFILQAENKIFMSKIFKNSPPSNLAGLIIDLRREPRTVETAKLIKNAINKGQGSLGSPFNFKRGLF